jgi:hypothetical protein
MWTVALCEGRRGGQFAVPVNAPRSNLCPRLLGRINTGGAELFTFSSDVLSGSLQNARVPLEQKVLSDEFSPISAVSQGTRKKGKRWRSPELQVPLTPFLLLEERHHEGMEIRNKETKRDTRRRLKKRGHIQFDTGNTTQIHEHKAVHPTGSAGQQSCQLSSQLCS